MTIFVKLNSTMDASYELVHYKERVHFSQQLLKGRSQLSTFVYSKFPTEREGEKGRGQHTIFKCLSIGGTFKK